MTTTDLTPRISGKNKSLSAEVARAPPFRLRDDFPSLQPRLQRTSVRQARLVVRVYPRIPITGPWPGWFKYSQLLLHSVALRRISQTRHDVTGHLAKSTHVQFARNRAQTSENIFPNVVAD